MMMITTADEIVSRRIPVLPAPPTLLDAAVAGRRGRLSPIDVAVLLADRYRPDAYSLAAIVAAVWGVAETPEVVESALRACALWEDDEIVSAVAATAGLYNGMLVRNSPAETGMPPVDGSGASPDIFSVGSRPVIDPATTFGADWGSAPTHSSIPGTTSHVYVRARNSFPGPESARLSLYVMPTPLLMRLSRAIPLRTSSGADSVEMSASRPDEIVVTREPFLWTPSTNEVAAGLLARIETPHTPAVPPRDEGIEGIVSWVACHPGFAWRSVGLFDAGPERERITRLRFGNPDSDPGRFLATVSCSGFPEGMHIHLRAPLSQIDTGMLPVGSSQTMLTSLVHLSGGLEDDLIVDLTDPNGTRLCTNGVIDVCYYAVVDGESPISAGLLTPASAGIADPALRGGDRLGLLGSYRMAFRAAITSVPTLDPYSVQYNAPDRRGESALAAGRTPITE